MCSFLIDVVLLLLFIVIVPPVIWIQNQMVGAYEGQQVILECYSEAYPKSINYWTTENGEIVPQSINLLLTHFNFI